ncbi:MFS transporter [Sphingomonadaceae bacterium G21617-S1]|nr:MFS transporter [Sphingomonadaceae bacterium G21617-S1]
MNSWQKNETAPLTDAPAANVTSTVVEDQMPFRPVRAWSSVGILMLFSLMSITDRKIISLLVEPIKHDLQLSDTQLGLLTGLAFSVTYSLIGLPMGWAVDRFSRRVIIFFGLMTWSLSAIYCGLVRTYTQLFIGRAGVGVGEAALSPVAVSLIGDLFPRDKISLPMGFYAASFHLGTGCALVAGGMVIGYFDATEGVALPLAGHVAPWQAALIVTGAPGLLFSLLVFLLPEPRRRPAPTLGWRLQLADFVRPRRTVIFCSFAGFALTSLATYAITAWTPAFLSRTFGWDSAEIGLIWGVTAGGAGIVGALAGGWSISRLYQAGVKEACLLFPGWAGMVAAPFLVLAYFLPEAWMVLTSLGAGLTILGTAAGASYATWQMISTPQFRGQLTAAFVLCTGLFGTGLGPLFVGLVTDHVVRDEANLGYSLAIVLGTVLPAMAILLLSGCRPLRRLLQNETA